MGTRDERDGPAWARPRQVAVRLTPAAGAAVMSTGILSTATQVADLRFLSLVLLALAALGALALGASLLGRLLGASLLGRLLGDRPGVVADAGTPASLTGVAATAVIGARIVPLGWTGVAWGLLAASALLWLVLLPFVLLHWQVPTVGTSLLVCVATEGLAVLTATQAAVTGSRPLVEAGFAAFVLGLLLYAVVLARFDWRQLAVGAGDQWVVAGALAIASLAGAHLVATSARLGLPEPVERPLRLLDLAVWVAAVSGCAVLLACELRWPRRRYDIRRWATVFPMGMTAAASFAVGQAEQLPALAVLGHLFLWPALAAWAVTAAGATAGRWRRLRRER